MLLDTYQNIVARIDGTLREVFEDSCIGTDPRRAANPLTEVGRYALSNPGKMLRGVLLLEACRAVDGDPDEVLYAAAALEYGQLASLVHDDLIDHDVLRRGKQSLWNAYGIDRAILVGDLFIFEAYLCVSLCRHYVQAERVAWALEALSQSCIDLCHGQAIEARLVGLCEIQRDDYLEMICRKTGSLFHAATETGAILGGGSALQVAAVRAYADCLGMAFQIQDDLLEYTTEERAAPKPNNSDLKNRRATLPILYALERASKEDVAALRAIFTCQETPQETSYDLDEAFATVCSILQRTDALERCREDTRILCRQSIECLAALPANDGRAALIAIAYLIGGRPA